mmetsp:Transcript_15341/g.33236  ORF Transcript_15341/g.33236 Transcript_15341/m.33236 type:complete len:564 (+) Transcript_15341:159-1850(+)
MKALGTQQPATSSTCFVPVDPRHLSRTKGWCYSKHPVQRRATRPAGYHGRHLIARASYDRDWGPFNHKTLSAASRTFEQALHDTQDNDLSIDFDRTYINNRRNSAGLATGEVDDPLGQSTFHALLTYQKLIAAFGAADHTAGTSGGVGANRTNQSSSDGAHASRMSHQASPNSNGSSHVPANHHTMSGSRASSNGNSPSATRRVSAPRYSNHSSGKPRGISSSDSHRPALSLAQCALLIGQHAEACCSIQEPDAVLAQLDAWAARVRTHQGQHNGHGSTDTLVQAVNQVLFSELDFRGCTQDYYDPANSCLARAMQRFTGNPTLLAIIYMEVARRAGLEVQPIVLPSHVFLRPLTMDGVACRYLIDPFNHGQICTRQVVEARINANWGCATPLIGIYEGLMEGLGPATEIELLMRLLRNLRESYWGPLPQSGFIRWNLNLWGAAGRYTQGYGSGLPSSKTGSHTSKAAGRSYGRGGDQLRRQLPPNNGYGSSQGPPPPMVEKALWVTRFMRATSPGNPRLIRDEGLILVCMGRPAEGSALLRQYLSLVPNAEDSHQVEEFISS